MLMMLLWSIITQTTTTTTTRTTTARSRTMSAMENKLLWIYTTIAIILTLAAFGSAQTQTQSNTNVQHFRVTPHDIQILEGTDTLLRCEISNRAGQVQWTKDGFALGFSAVISGFPRYSVLVDAKNGIYNLQIKNTSLDDDAEYQCQVGPAAGNPAIRANAKLSIVAAPSAIYIEGYENNAKLEVAEKQNLTLQCIAENANPAAEIVWYQANVPLKNIVPVTQTKELSAKRFTTISNITLQPRATDDLNEYTCEARHRALPPDVPMRANVQLSVLHQPGAPILEGLPQEKSLRRGQKVQIVCRSIGGNPPAQLTWFKNGVAISSPQRTSGRLSENIYKFVAEAEDNGANLICEAKNILLNVALRAEVNLTVQFAPKEVNVSGPADAKIGDIVELNCITAPSNPPARISWSINGRPLHNNSNQKSYQSTDGGWISSASINLTIDAQSRSFSVVCHAFNADLTQNILGTHTVHVLYPPSPPLLTGYNDGDIVTFGSIKKLHCSSMGGNPPPELHWYKNDKRLNAVVKVVDSKILSELSILVNATDNNAIYKCEIQSPATELPLFATKTLNVHFPPETVKITIQPKNLVPGVRAKLICDSSSSNPPAKISWWKDGIPVEGVNLSNRPGLWGGTVSTLEMDVNITKDLDGIVYTCQSSNEALQRSVHESISLDILYPPKFDEMPERTFVGVEGEAMVIALQATGNPMGLTYTWTRDGLPITANSAGSQRIISTENVLNITRLTRNDAGNYICEAMNSQGTAILEVQVVVEYMAKIVSITEDYSFTAGDEAVLTCTVDAQPLKAEHVRWQRADYGMAARTTTSFENGTAYLHIQNVQRADMGNFTCHVYNNIGTADERNVLLVVQSAPELNHAPAYSRFAARLGDTGRLVCQAMASPEPNFIWRRNGKDIKFQRRSSRYRLLEHRHDAVTYESTLLIENTLADDYGQYECVTRNTHGQASMTIEFGKPMQPDAPLNFRVANASDDAVQLLWSAGFDGGLPVYYRIRYKLSGDDKYRYEEVRSGYTNITLSGLQVGGTYAFSVMAVNEAGASKYPHDIKLKLAKDAQPYSAAAAAEYAEKNEMPNLMVIGITSAAMVLLVLNAALVAWFVMRKQNKSTSQAESANDDAYSKDDNQSVYKLPITALQADVQQRVASSTYLVENVDIIQSTAYPPKYQESSMCNSTPSYVQCGGGGGSINGGIIGGGGGSGSGGSTNGCIGMGMGVGVGIIGGSGGGGGGIGNNLDFTRTLPNPKRHSTRLSSLEPMMVSRSKDDHVLMSNGFYIPSPSPASSLVIKGSYISSPSPAPPPDGSYFNMSDKYISYPPVAY